MRVAAIEPVHNGYLLTVMDDTKVLSTTKLNFFGEVLDRLDHFNVPPHRTLVEAGAYTANMYDICGAYGFLPCKCVSPKSNAVHIQGFNHNYPLSVFVIPVKPYTGNNGYGQFEDSISMIRFFIGD